MARPCQAKALLWQGIAKSGWRLSAVLPGPACGLARPCQGQGVAWQSIANQRPAIGQAPGAGAGRSARKCGSLPPPARDAAVTTSRSTIFTGRRTPRLDADGAERRSLAPVVGAAEKPWDPAVSRGCFRRSMQIGGPAGSRGPPSARAPQRVNNMASSMAFPTSASTRHKRASGLRNTWRARIGFPG